MANIENKKSNNQDSIKANALDDEQRVMVLSPGMLVTKRFLRNHLALVGLIIIVFMFSFSFIGGVLSSYGEREVFRTYETALKDYAGASVNKEYQFTNAKGKEFPALAKADMILAINKNSNSFISDDIVYTLIKETEGLYRIVQLKEAGSIMTVKGITSFTQTGDVLFTDSIKEACSKAITANEQSFEVEGVTYVITKNGKMSMISLAEEVAIATTMVFHTYAKDTNLTSEFKVEAQKAIANKLNSFHEDGLTYTLENRDNTALIFLDGKEYTSASQYSIKAIASDVFLSIDFKLALEQAIRNNETKLEFANELGEVEQYVIERNNTQYTIKREESTQVNNTYESPSWEHWLGTDGNGMDVMTRLMYGGRISLLIGFIVVILEIVLGIIIGGVSGYFGGWIDTFCMRMVDVFNCIPSMPLYIILGAIMDFMKINPGIRIYFLCVVLGILTWPKVARMVRGQILSLREQEFMIATEATGIRTSKRIFKHLIPNVIPQIVVMATMGLGDVILLEATLSFFGLGVKYPYASWGNIVNAVNDIYVMTNFWFVWIPAGLLILITVLGFNFIGDGLRDAFDPKMKR